MCHIIHAVTLHSTASHDAGDILYWVDHVLYESTRWTVREIQTEWSVIEISEMHLLEWKCDAGCKVLTRDSEESVSHQVFDIQTCPNNLRAFRLITSSYAYRSS